MGSLPHLLGEQFKSLIAADLTDVPYKGTGALLPDLMSGRVAFAFPATTGVLSHVKAGSVRALAITSPKRIALMPNVPTMAEAGYPQINSIYRSAIVAPPGLPAAIEAQLTAALQQVTQDAATITLLETGGFERGVPAARRDEVGLQKRAAEVEGADRGQWPAPERITGVPPNGENL
ncbi:tripartite tricarboxylate transporter substrate-binding protein [Variovorax sp. UC122_21]|uniref:tripartite tricarboxylate transporter substrate-binding protein n=1 Tax=Variovorax sp. UC122_21 TaxID=3374554 RepID=UPI0037577521